MCCERSRSGRATSICAIVFAALATGSAAVFAQAVQQPAASQPAAAADLPAAKSLIDRHLSAAGGRKALLAHSSSHTTGTMSMPANGMSGQLEVFAAKPNKMLVKVKIEGIGEVLEGFDGTTAWSISPMTGPMIASEKEREQKKFDADFHGELNPEGRYKSLKTVEKTTFDNRECYKVSLVRHDGVEDFEFFDVATGLRAGRIVTRESPMGTITATQITGDYKKFGDVLLPTVTKQTMMGIQQIITITAVEYDKVQPTVFELPAPIKALVK